MIAPDLSDAFELGAIMREEQRAYFAMVARKAPKETLDNARKTCVDYENRFDRELARLERKHGPLPEALQHAKEMREAQRRAFALLTPDAPKAQQARAIARARTKELCFDSDLERLGYAAQRALPL